MTSKGNFCSKHHLNNVTLPCKHFVCILISRPPNNNRLWAVVQRTRFGTEVKTALFVSSARISFEPGSYILTLVLRACRGFSMRRWWLWDFHLQEHLNELHDTIYQPISVSDPRGPNGFCRTEPESHSRCCCIPHNAMSVLVVQGPTCLVKNMNRIVQTKMETRLHCSRMRTARALTVSPSMLCAGGGGLLPGGCIPACTEAL